MIVLFHAASGAAAGALTRSRIGALALGPVLHVAADRVPHRHPAHTGWEYLAGSVALGALARRRGVFDVATLGALAPCCPISSTSSPCHVRAARSSFTVCAAPIATTGPVFDRRPDAAGGALLAPLLVSARRPTGAKGGKGFVARGDRR